MPISIGADRFECAGQAKIHQVETGRQAGRRCNYYHLSYEVSSRSIRLAENEMKCHPVASLTGGPAIDNGKPQGSSSAWVGFGEGQAALGLAAKDPPVLLTFVQMFGALQSMNVCLRYLCTK